MGSRSSAGPDPPRSGAVGVAKAGRAGVRWSTWHKRSPVGKSPKKALTYKDHGPGEKFPKTRAAGRFFAHQRSELEGPPTPSRKGALLLRALLKGRRRGRGVPGFGDVPKKKSLHRWGRNLRRPIHQGFHPFGYFEHSSMLGFSTIARPIS